MDETFRGDACIYIEAVWKGYKVKRTLTDNEIEFFIPRNRLLLPDVDNKTRQVTSVMRRSDKDRNIEYITFN